jgi:hypothetical protein
MNKRHFILFLFVHFLCINKFKRSKRADQSEGGGAAHYDEFQVDCDLLGLAFRQNQTQHLLKYASALNPEFVNLNSWLNCIRLENYENLTQSETTATNSFYKKLTKSLRNNPKKWTEYLLMDKSDRASIDLNEKDIDLLNDTPLDADLSLIDKLIIWLIIRPDKVNKKLIFEF